MGSQSNVSTWNKRNAGTTSQQAGNDEFGRLKMRSLRRVVKLNEESLSFSRQCNATRHARAKACAFLVHWHSSSSTLHAFTLDTRRHALFCLNRPTSRRKLHRSAVVCRTREIRERV